MFQTFQTFQTILNLVICISEKMKKKKLFFWCPGEVRTLQTFEYVRNKQWTPCLVASPFPQGNTVNYPKKPGFNLHESRNCALTAYSVKTWFLSTYVTGRKERDNKKEENYKYCRKWVEKKTINKTKKKQYYAALFLQSVS